MDWPTIIQNMNDDDKCRHGPTALCTVQSLNMVSKYKVRIYSKSTIGGRRSPAVACWASDHWVASSNPLRGKFRH